MGKKSLAALFLCMVSLLAKAQDVSVERSLWQVQTGVLGVWASNECRLADRWSFRSEVGLDAAIWGGDFYEKTGFVMLPTVSVEPRWYYNLDRRNAISKNVRNNSANYLSFMASLHPDLFVISNYDDLTVVNQISVGPNWGLRRSIGAHFSFEASFGLHYYYAFAKSSGFSENESGIGPNMSIRIGYCF